MHQGKGAEERETEDGEAICYLSLEILKSIDPEFIGGGKLCITGLQWRERRAGILGWWWPLSRMSQSGLSSAQKRLMNHLT
jgi:hypothetical protein